MGWEPRPIGWEKATMGQIASHVGAKKALAKKNI